MEEMRIYIANLGKYNEGELVGAWFTPPVDFEEVKERIGLNDEYEEYAIHDYELPFEIDEYTPIEEVNRLCEIDVYKRQGGHQTMRLANGIVIDKEATFGALKFSALRREVHLQNEDGSVSEEIKERTYDLKSRGQGRMIQVSIPCLLYTSYHQFSFPV